MILKRHFLIDVTDRGRQAILDEVSGSGPQSARRRERYARVLLPDQAGARIPGVARREEGVTRPDGIPVGFSAPIAGKEGRLRVTAFVRPEEIARTTSPYDLLALVTVVSHNACTRALEIAKRQARTSGLLLGVWGSVAAELYTGLSCTHRDSDLDLLVAAAPRQTLFRFLVAVEALEKSMGLRIDVELDCFNGYGVQLKELFGQGRTVLGKSLTDVALLPREQILAELPQEPPWPIPAANIGGQHG